MQWLGYGLDDREIRVRCPVRMKPFFLFFLISKIYPGTHPVSCPIDTEDFPLE
jgi:hypothetical protein